MRWDYLELVPEAGGVAELTIPESPWELSLLFYARDAAGNEAVAKRGAVDVPSDFLVTTNKWVQIIKKPAETILGHLPAGVAVAGVIALFPVFVLYCKKYRRK